MADQQDATSADVETSATEDDDTATDDQDLDAGTTEDADTDQGHDDEPLREAGVKALNAEKEKRRLALRQRRQALRERDEALAEAERLKQALEKQSPKGDGETDADKGPDLDAIRAEAAEEAKAQARAELLAERVTDRIEVLAAKRFQDAEDALAHLMRIHEVDDFLDGDKVDAEAIKEALDELLEKKPYLAVPAQGEAKRFKGSGDGGAKPTKQPRPTSIHEAVSRTLTKS